MGSSDDLIVYRLSQHRYRCVVNAATREKDLAWLESCAADEAVKIHPREDLAILAIQGPLALTKIQPLFGAAQYEMIMQLKPFQCIEINHWFIARTGYTGEDGIEIMLPQEEVVLFWQQLQNQQIRPVGLGARDTLRLEAGFNLYGQDMDGSVTPLESNLGWTIDWQDEARNFIGKNALMMQRENGIKQKLMGVVLLEKGVCRAGMEISGKNSAGELRLMGKLTSGCFSPTLSCGIGFARISVEEFLLPTLTIRGKKCPIKIINPPFCQKRITEFFSLK